MGYDNTARARELAENIIPCFETGDGETPIHYDRSRICALIRQALDREHDLAIEECALHVETKLMRRDGQIVAVSYYDENRNGIARSIRTLKRDVEKDVAA